MYSRDQHFQTANFQQPKDQTSSRNQPEFAFILIFKQICRPLNSCSWCRYGLRTVGSKAMCFDGQPNRFAPWGSHGFRWQSNRGHLSKYQKWPILKDWEMALKNPSCFVVSSSKHLHEECEVDPYPPNFQLVFTIRPSFSTIIFKCIQTSTLQMTEILPLRPTLSPSNGFHDVFMHHFTTVLANVFHLQPRLVRQKLVSNFGRLKGSNQILTSGRLGYFLTGGGDASC